MLLRSLLFSVLFNIPVSHAQEPAVIEGYAQGTSFRVLYYDTLDRDLQEEIFDLLRGFDQSVSTYVDSSVISKVNKNEPVELDSTFIHCFERAKEIWELTHGAFDPTVYPLVKAYGFGAQKVSDPEEINLDSLMAFVGFDKIEISNGVITKTDPRISLDFNAFAQGYSVDLVAQLLERKGINSYLIEIGGELVGKGTGPDGESWTIGIERPDVDSETGQHELDLEPINGTAVASSGNFRKFYEYNGRKYVHEIDPKSGLAYPSSLLSVTVFASDCLTADALATALMVMGYERSLEFLSVHKEFRAVLYFEDADGNMSVTDIK